MADDPLWGNLFRKSSKEKEAFYNVLKNVPIYEDLTRREIAKIEGISV